MICKACKNDNAYQPFIGPLECPQPACEYFTQRRFNEVNSGRKYNLKKLSTIDNATPGNLIRILWSVSPEASKYNGLYKITQIELDSTNLVELVRARPTDQAVEDKEYVFHREHLIEAFVVVEEEEKTPTQPFLAWNWFNLPWSL